MFFFANSEVTIDQPAFWEMSYMLRIRDSRADGSTNSTDNESIRKKESSSKESTTVGAYLKMNDQGCVDILCPIFLKDIARAIVSAGKSFQLIQHVQDAHRILTRKDTYASNLYQSINCSSQQKIWPDTSSLRIQDGHPRSEDALEESTCQFGNDSREMGLLTLSEIFLICLSGLLENGDHVYEYLRRLHADSVPNNKAFVESESNVQETKDICAESSTEKTWVRLLKNATSGRKYDGIEKTISRNTVMDKPIFVPGDPQDASSNAVEAGHFTLSCYENPAITACREVLLWNPNSWSELNISENFHLPSLNDGNMRRAIFANAHSAGTSTIGDTQPTSSFPRLDGTDYKFGFQFSDLDYVRQEDDRRTLEVLYAFPTLLPCANVRLASKV